MANEHYKIFIDGKLVHNVQSVEIVENEILITTKDKVMYQLESPSGFCSCEREYPSSSNMCADIDIPAPDCKVVNQFVVKTGIS